MQWFRNLRQLPRGENLRFLKGQFAG